MAHEEAPERSADAGPVDCLVGRQEPKRDPRACAYKCGCVALNAWVCDATNGDAAGEPCCCPCHYEQAGKQRAPHGA